MDQQTLNPAPRAQTPMMEVSLGRRLPWGTQLTLLLFTAALIVAGPVTVHLLGLSRPDEKPAETPRAEVGQAFKVTNRQWATLKVMPVSEDAFQDTIETDGKIALDDDLVTPVFSPFSGRITRLIAHAGRL